MHSAKEHSSVDIMVYINMKIEALEPGEQDGQTKRLRSEALLHLSLN